MDKISKTVLALIILFPLAAFPGLGVGSGADVRVKGDVAWFSGRITEESVAAFLAAVAGKPVHTLVIDSGGGEVNAGMALGEWVHENNADVAVDGLCMSSCANYVFPAARIKTLLPGAVVAWHGSAEQADFRDRDSLARVLRESLGGRVPEGEAFQDLVERTWAYLTAARERQAAFYLGIGVDEELTRVGNEKLGAEDFYTLSVEDMARFGVENVFAPKDYPPDLTGLNRQRPVVFLSLPPDP